MGGLVTMLGGLWSGDFRGHIACEEGGHTPQWGRTEVSTPGAEEAMLGPAGAMCW